MKRLYLSLPLVLLLVGCATSNSGSQEQRSSNNTSGYSSSIVSSDSSSSGSESSSSSSSSSSSGLEGGETWAFDFKDNDHTNTWEVSTHKDEFLEYLNKDGDIVASFEETKCFFQPVGQTGKTSLLIGTGSASGSLSLTFKYPVSKISFVLQGYHKWNSYAGAWSLDPDSQLDVEGEHYDLSSSDTSNPPEEVSDSIDISPNKKTITFSNSDENQRAFIHSLTITYIA